MTEMRVSNEFDTLFPIDMDLSSLRIVVVESSENRLIVKSVRKDLEDKLAAYNNAQLNIDEIYVPSAWHIPYAVQEIFRQHAQRFDPFPVVIALGCLIEESSTDFRSPTLFPVTPTVPVFNGILMASTALQAERRCQGRANALTGNTETFGAELATEAICLSGMKRVIKNLDADEDIKTEDSDVL
ncbi:hypothetical protein FOL46_007855 [Perkinsus olseni]|uniref:6,7-dimethyl-8-ribityllumazine synthase n=1 Tax=Perkinsus olseni TaxID=32597 RepID=A0A7J6LAU6_PEROL|nr:hypothetical protein FOL46_007855 [Perkinsus olseni]